MSSFVNAIAAQRLSSTTPWAVLIALSVLAVGLLDVISTNAGLLAGGVEANPLMAWAQSSFGTWWAAPKLGLQLITAAIVLFRPARMVFVCVGVVVGWNAFVVLNNFAIAGTL